MEITLKKYESAKDYVAAETGNVAETFGHLRPYLCPERVVGAQAVVQFYDTDGANISVTVSKELTPFVRSGQVTLEDLLTLDFIKSNNNGGLYFCDPRKTTGTQKTVAEIIANSKPKTIIDWLALAAL